MDIEQRMNIYDNTPINFREDTVICNKLVINDTGNIKNMICLIVKQYIYRQRCLKKPLSAREVWSVIGTVENMEKYNAVKNNTLHKHLRKWYPSARINDSPQEKGIISEFVEAYISLI